MGHGSTAATRADWPDLPALAEWEDTVATIHRWMQIVGKVRLASTTLVNHWWNVPLYVTEHGLTTSPMPHGGGRFTIEFDFLAHRLRVATSWGDGREFPLRPMSVATFYRQVTSALASLGVAVTIRPMPVEIPDPVERFDRDEAHASYDADAVQRFWRALLQAERVFTDFRARYVGKVSPVHFFWGAIDLAVTRFSGRRAPRHPGGAPHVADWVMEEAYSHEVSSAGFWPGTGLGEAAFYAYAYPEPAGFRDAAVQPGAAYFHPELGEFILPYAAVRSASDPDAALLAFLQTTYEAAADRASWNRAELERR